MASAENTTNHQTNQSTSSSAPSSVPLIKMTNASDEPTAQHHQQELIRLLAQHFNSQLAGRAAYDQQLTLPVPLTSLGGGALNSFQSALVHYHQQEQQQLRLNQGAINFCTQQNRAVNFEPPTSQTFLNNHHSVRAQPSTNATINPFSMTNSMIATSSHSSGLPSGAHPAASCNPLVNDMNLFNALNCFGLPNEQLVLSLQQQYLFQAANAARQIESRFAGRADNEDPTLNTGRQSSLDSGARQNFRHHLTSKRSLNGNLPELGNGMVNEQGGRDLLKFSINTILGNGAPLSAMSDHQQSRSDASPIDRFFGSGNTGQLLPGNRVADENRDSQHATGRQISPECDPDIMTDIDSESSMSPISNVHSDPSGMATNLSRLSGDAEHPNINHLHNHHHQSASSSASPKKGLATNSLTSNDASHHQQSISFLAGSTAFPWTVASRGKPRRGMMRRAVFSDSQRVGLEKRFQLQKYISKPDRKKLAEKLGLRDSQVKIWFQNRRMKWRNSKERELLSAGGSREQTLPTRNNPNPDLSDVGETIKRLVASNNNTGNNIGTV